MMSGSKAHVRAKHVRGYGCWGKTLNLEQVIWGLYSFVAIKRVYRNPIPSLFLFVFIKKCVFFYSDIFKSIENNDIVR